MTIVVVDRTAFVQVNTVAQRIQIFGGRVQIADSASPAADDWQVFPEGALVDVTGVKFARAVDVKSTWIVVQAV